MTVERRGHAPVTARLSNRDLIALVGVVVTACSILLGAIGKAAWYVAAKFETHGGAIMRLEEHVKAIDSRVGTLEVDTRELVRRR